MNEERDDIKYMDRAQLKALARERLHNPAIARVLRLSSIVIILIAILFGTYIYLLPSGKLSSSNDTMTIARELVSSRQQSQMWSMLSDFASMFFIAGFNFTALDVIRNKDAEISISHTLLRVFNGRYFWLVLGTQILVNLATSIGFMLLIIPGVLLSFGLMLTTFVLYDTRERQPRVDLFKVLADAYRITRGHKFDLFVLGLSFFWWDLLGVITAGIGFIWIYPYIQLTTAAYYEQLRLRYEDEHPQAD
ncbi:DUF975 family protein [Lacticaseibacillus pabuli]|uniref:DUF975 family protein n=1 Tax=Lacticaseibacillus pabuli TaxID=3025672 RepID=A0ABY7WX68_9LACO|nr:DUF975 family protein [Lacticaseibacillus sp. KACC 23028]WDF82525.1 DUF975 family protein [Lacticaseibacillus sp. KACC 23028]